MGLLSFICVNFCELELVNKNQPQTNANPQSYKACSSHRFITLSYNSSSNSKMNNLNKLDIKTTSLPFKNNPQISTL